MPPTWSLSCCAWWPAQTALDRVGARPGAVRSPGVLPAGRPAALNVDKHLSPQRESASRVPDQGRAPLCACTRREGNKDAGWQ